jgi:valyl-tRNA synthetase
MVAPFPEPDEFLADEDSLMEMDILKGVITGIRNVRGEMNIPPKKSVKVIIDVKGSREREVLENNSAHITSLAKVESMDLVSGIEKPESSAGYILGDIQVHVLLKGLLNYEDERKRIRKLIEKMEREIEISRKKLANKDFVNQAPSHIVDGVRERVELINLKLEKLNRNLANLEGLT